MITVNAVRGRLQGWFPDREFFMRSRGQVRFVTVTSKMQMAAAGGALAILAFLVGMAVNMPTSKRLAALGSAAAARGGPPTPEEGAELQRLQGRMATANQIVMVLLLLATAAMAVARYIQ